MSASPSCQVPLAGAEPVPCVVLDIETRPDQFARILASSSTESRSPLLVRIANGSIMEFDRHSDGSISNLRMRSFHENDYDESDIVMNMVLSITRCVEEGGEVVTYNGTKFDLPILRFRQLRWWLMSQVALRSLLEGAPGHTDVMTALTVDRLKPPKLSDACAAFGFSLTGPIRLADRSTPPRQRCKCETDVIATTILYLYLLAERDGARSELVDNLKRLGAYLRKIGRGLSHIERFAHDPLLGDLAGPWTDRSGGDADHVNPKRRRGRPPILR